MQGSSISSADDSLDLRSSLEQAFAHHVDGKPPPPRTSPSYGSSSLRLELQDAARHEQERLETEAEAQRRLDAEAEEQRQRAIETEVQRQLSAEAEAQRRLAIEAERKKQRHTALLRARTQKMKPIRKPRSRAKMRAALLENPFGRKIGLGKNSSISRPANKPTKKKRAPPTPRNDSIAPVLKYYGWDAGPNGKSFADIARKLHKHATNPPRDPAAPRLTLLDHYKDPVDMLRNAIIRFYKDKNISC